MSFSIELTKRFKREFKRLVKKFPSVKTEFANLIDSLEENPIQGTPHLSGMAFIKFGQALQVKEKANGAVQE